MPGTFKTNTGYCHITDTYLVLNGFPELEGGEEAPVQPWKHSPLFFPMAAVGILAFILAYIFFEKEKQLWAMLSAVVGVLLLQWVIRMINVKRSEGIPLEKISRMRYFAGSPPFTKAYFIMYYEKANGRNSHKIIPLPYTKTAALEEGTKALALFEEHHVRVADA